MNNSVSKDLEQLAIFRLSDFASEIAALGYPKTVGDFMK